MWRMPGCRTNERKRKMRRLPVYLVLDVSESMAGKAIEEVKNGIQLLTDALMSNPYAMETVYISVIAFAGKAKVLIFLFLSFVRQPGIRHIRRTTV